MPDGTRVRMLRCVTREGGADIPVALIPATGAVHNRMLGAAGGQIVEFAGRPRLYRPEKGGPILAFTVTDLRIREVAESVGYWDTSYFGRLYKREFAMTPEECRLRRDLLL